MLPFEWIVVEAFDEIHIARFLIGSFHFREDSEKHVESLSETSNGFSRRRN